MSNFKKVDKYLQEIFPGDVCVYNGEIVVYKKESWGGEGSKGEFGKFITESGIRSFKYKNVVFAFDPMGKRNNKSKTTKELCREFYEGK